MPKYYIQSESTDTVIKTFEVFDREAIREAICDHLIANPTDYVDYYKEASKNELKRFVGDNFIDCYTISPYNGEPSKVVESTTYPYKRRFISILKKKKDD